MRKRLWILTCVAALGGAMIGCGDDGGVDPEVDSGMTEETDSGPVSELPLATIAGGMAPDWSCVGTNAAPTAGAPITVAATFGGPLNPTLPDGTVVNFYPGNAVTADPCTAPDCVTAMTTGNVATVMLPADAWFAYRVPMTSATFPTVGYFRPAAAATGETVIGNAVVTFIPSIFSRMRLPGTTVVSGAAYDCMGRPVGGVEARVFVDGVRVAQGDTQTSPFVGYLEGVASTMVPYTTSVSAQFAMANIPPGATRLELWAVREAGEAPTRVACEEVQSYADTVIVASPPGLRSASDYPAGSGCL